MGKANQLNFYNTQQLTPLTEQSLPAHIKLPKELIKADQETPRAINCTREATKAFYHYLHLVKRQEQLSDQTDKLNESVETLSKIIESHKTIEQRCQQIMSRRIPDLLEKTRRLRDDCDSLLKKVTRYRVMPYRGLTKEDLAQQRTGSQIDRLKKTQASANQILQKINGQFLRSIQSGSKLPHSYSTTFHNTELLRLTRLQRSVNSSITKTRSLDLYRKEKLEEIRNLSKRLAEAQKMLAGNLELRREIKGQLKENLLKYEQNWYKAADAFNKLCRDLVGDLTRISESADFVEAQRNLLIKTAKKIQLQLNQIPSCHSLDACSALELSVKSIEQIIEQAKDRWFALKLEKREQIQPQPLEEHTIAPIRKKELVKITSITPPMINDLRAVERLSFEHPKSESWWRQSHLAPDHRILCAKVGSEVIGFIVYRITTSSVRVLSLAVEPEYRRQGIGKRLINRAKMSLSENRPYFALDVDQGNLDAHNFLKALKIRGRSINPDNTYHFMTKLKIRGAPKDST